MVGNHQFAVRNIAVLREAQNGLNVAFGAILSAYIGVGLAQIDHSRFDTHVLARFFLCIGTFILCLCVGNSMLHRSEYRLAATFLLIGGAAALFASHEARLLGFELTILRILTSVWVVGLLASNVALTIIISLHHRKRT